VGIVGFQPEILGNSLGVVEISLRHQQIEPDQHAAIIVVEVASIGWDEGGVHDGHELSSILRESVIFSSGNGTT
jgi:hypothetical protein